MMENYQIDINKENKKTDDIYNIATEILKNAHRIAKVQTSSKDITEVKDWEYAEEADFLNIAVFGMTAKEWREKNKDRAKDENIRDSASINELLVITNLESQNAAMMREGLDKKTRLEKLQEIAQIELVFVTKMIVIGLMKMDNHLLEKYH